MVQRITMSPVHVILAIVVTAVVIVALAFIIFEGKVIRGACKIFVYTLYGVSQVTSFGAQATLQVALSQCDKYQF